MGMFDDLVPEEQPAQGGGMFDDMLPAPSAGPGGQFDQHIEAASRKYGLPVSLLRAQIQAESSFNPNARSPVGAAGLMQLMPGTARELGVTDPYDPAQNIDAGARYMRQMLDKFGRLDKAAAAYNFGPGNVAKGRALPKETRDYVAKLQKATPDLPWYEQIAHGMTRVPIGALQLAQKAIPEGVRESGQQLLEQGVQALGGRGPTTEGDPLKEMETTYQRQRKESGDTGFDWLDLAGNIASPWSWGVGAATRLPALAAGGALRTGAQAALTGAAEGALQPAYGDNFAQEKAIQSVIGGAAGPVFAGLGGLASNMLGKSAGILTGKLDDNADELMRLSKQHGVPLTQSDISGRKIPARMEAILERTPVLGIDRGKQQVAAAGAASKLQKDLQKEMTNLSFQSLDRVRQAAESGGPRSGAAQRLLAEVADAGDDWQKIIQTSGNLRAFRMQLNADELYDDVARLAGEKPLNPANTAQALDDVLAQLDKKLMPDTGTQNFIARIQSRIDNSDMPKTFESMKALRTDIAEELQALRTGRGGENAVISSRGARYLAQLDDAIEKDMDAFAKSTPELSEAWSRASSFYKSKVAPYRSRDLARALSNEDADTVYKAFLGQGKNSATRFYNSLDERGRAAVRYGMFTHAVDEATDAAAGTFRPKAFAAAMNKVQKQQGVYFKGEQLAQIQGFTKLMDHMQRASMAQTGSDFAGNSVIPSIGLGVASTAGVLPATSAAGLMYGAKLMLTTRFGQRLLNAANLAKVGSKGMQEIADEAERKIIEAGVEATTGGMAQRATEMFNQQLPVVGGAIGGRAGGDQPDDQGRKLP